MIICSLLDPVQPREKANRTANAKGIIIRFFIAMVRMIGAGNGVRTRDPQLGKLMLYQLSYARSQTITLKESYPLVKVKRGV